MKKVIFLAVLLFSTYLTHSQDVKRTLGVGLQSSLPTYGLSVKYGITKQSVVQATIAPFGSGIFSTNFYGGRYIHRFTDDDQGKVSLDPYVFAGVGLMTFKTDLSGFGLGSSSDSFISYSLGGGVELLVARKLGISAEIGYGKMNIIDGLGVNSILAGGGIHFYIF
jgi:opacity protein-like surface antigen